jgi:hypothetical protein
MRLSTTHELTTLTSLYSLHMRYLLSTATQTTDALQIMTDAASDRPTSS